MSPLKPILFFVINKHLNILKAKLFRPAAGIQQRRHLYCLILLGQKSFCIRSPDTKRYMLIPTIFLSLFSHLHKHTNPTTLMDANQKVGVLFYLCFMSPAFLITIVPLHKLIIITIVIVIMPYFYLLMCYKVIRNIF